MTVSYWGVDHGDEVSKADNQRSTGRAFLASNSPGIHAPIAAKKGKKLKAFGNSAGGALGGAAVGGTAGLLATRNMAGGFAGSGLGGVAGAYGGYRRNASRGYYKPLKG